ncbi:hypothetical protein KCU98_g264, partial [Aureobasidium melanogenum]
LSDTTNNSTCSAQVGGGLVQRNDVDTLAHTEDVASVGGIPKRERCRLVKEVEPGSHERPGHRPREVECARRTSTRWDQGIGIVASKWLMSEGIGWAWPPLCGLRRHEYCGTGNTERSNIPCRKAVDRRIMRKRWLWSGE